MAKKKVEIALQEEIQTQEEWDNSLQKEGLLVIDIYQGWSGPCKAVVGLFRRLKAELNDDYLNFAVAKADTIEALEKYRGKCEPCFLFFGGGKLVAVVRGVNPPVLEKNIISKLKQEHEVMKGETERVEVKDTVIVEYEYAEAEEKRRKEEEEEIEQEITIAVLKPDIVSAGRSDELVQELIDKGIEIIERKKHQFTNEEAEEFYVKLKSEPYFPKLVEFMTSGPSEVLICAKGAEGVTEELRGLVGPAILEGEESTGLRAKYASDVIRNAIHAADGREEAARELAFFYPDYQPPTVTVRRPKLSEKVSEEPDVDQGQGGTGSQLGIQRTVALLRPQAYAQYKDAILERIQEAGFVISSQKEIQLTKEQAEAYYSEHEGEAYFGELTTIMSSAPILALLLARQDAVETWRNMLGPSNVEEAKTSKPDCLRAQFAPEDDSTRVNLIHGSSTDAEVQRDLEFFFPVERTVAAIKPDAYANRDEIIERIKLAGFHVAARKDTQLSEEMAKQLYADVKDKPFFDDLIKHMTSGPTLFMVLSRQDAVSGWRKLMGPADPDKAADEKADSIRAIYGRNVLENAVHGSSSEQHAINTIKLIFGDSNVGIPEKPDEVVQGEEEETAEAANDGLFHADERLILEAEIAKENESIDKPVAAESPVEEEAHAEEPSASTPREKLSTERTSAEIAPADEHVSDNPELTPPAERETPVEDAPDTAPVDQAPERSSEIPPEDQNQSSQFPNNSNHGRKSLKISGSTRTNNVQSTASGDKKKKRI